MDLHVSVFCVVCSRSVVGISRYFTDKSANVSQSSATFKTSTAGGITRERVEDTSAFSMPVRVSHVWVQPIGIIHPQFTLSCISNGACMC